MRDDAPPRNIWRDPEADDEGDPLLAFGQFVKDASKGLWKKVSLKDAKTLKVKTASDTPTGVQNIGEHSGDQLLVVDVGRGMGRAKDNEVGAWKENVDAISSTQQDSGTAPGAQQQT